MILNANSPKYREELWDACVDGSTGFVFCNLCGGRVLPTEAWHESHIGVPKAWGGNEVGIAHVLCNQFDNVTFVTPQTAKTKRMWRKHQGIAGRGITITPLPAGRRSNISKKLNGEVVPRIIGRGAKHRQTMAALYPPEFVREK